MHCPVRLSDATGQCNNWIVDSGATCHMCNDSKQFVELRNLEQPEEVILGDGHAVKTTSRGTVTLRMRLSGGKLKRCNLLNVSFTHDLSYNLLSIPQVACSGKKTEFNETSCQILKESNELIALANRVGSLYYLDCESGDHACVA